MRRQFAALRFFEDGNISDRTYWYLCDLSVKVGDEVFAPVGARSRLQRARVERVLFAEEEEAPYDVSLCKHVAAKCGERKRTAGEYVCYEMGGVRYDEKRYTAFGRVLISEQIPQTLSVLEELGAAECVAERGAEEALCRVLNARGCVLVCGACARDVAEILLAAARGEAEKLGLSAREAAALAEKIV